jgi:opacity protein-like surface antigen
LERNMNKRLLAGILVFAAVAAAPALAQAPQPIRGTIDKVDGPVVSIKEAGGSVVAVKLTDNAQVFGVVSATAADIKANDFIGVGAMPQPDGSQKAIQVTIFAPSQRGIGEGFRPWDRPGTTMTNGTVDTTVVGVNGRVLTVKYKGGEQKIVIADDAKIRAYVAGDKSELKPGAHVAIVRPEKAPDGSLQTTRINVGRGGMVP